jgi:phosphoglycerate kinase
MRCVDEADISLGTKVVVRCDLDVPLTDGKIGDTFRLDTALTTLNYIIDRGGLPVIVGHIGRPEGKSVKELSTSQLQPYFDANLHGRYELLENLRFDPREEANDPTFAKELARNGECYVNESFATCHRTAASVTGVAVLLPSYAGFRLVQEVISLKKIVTTPARPLVAIIGGAKLESKQPLIAKFAQLADAVLVGGRLALEGSGGAESGTPGIAIHWPEDYVDEKDIGPKTLQAWQQVIAGAKTIIWAGPVGLFEEARYSTGTRRVGELVTKAVAQGCFAVVGGGDTVNALTRFGLVSGVSFVSTGGSAMLDFLIYGTLPGIEALWQRNYK